MGELVQYSLQDGETHRHLDLKELTEKWVFYADIPILYPVIGSDDIALLASVVEYASLFKTIYDALGTTKLGQVIEKERVGDLVCHDLSTLVNELGFRKDKNSHWHTLKGFRAKKFEGSKVYIHMMCLKEYFENFRTTMESQGGNDIPYDLINRNFVVLRIFGEGEFLDYNRVMTMLDAVVTSLHETSKRVQKELYLQPFLEVKGKFEAEDLAKRQKEESVQREAREKEEQELAAEKLEKEKKEQRKVISLASRQKAAQTITPTFCEENANEPLDEIVLSDTQIRRMAKREGDVSFLTAYLNAAARKPLLTHEETNEIAKKLGYYRNLYLDLLCSMSHVESRLRDIQNHSLEEAESLVRRAVNRIRFSDRHGPALEMSSIPENADVEHGTDLMTDEDEDSIIYGPDEQKQNWVCKGRSDLARILKQMPMEARADFEEIVLKEARTYAKAAEERKDYLKRTANVGFIQSVVSQLSKTRIPFSWYEVTDKHGNSLEVQAETQKTEYGIHETGRGSRPAAENQVTNFNRHQDSVPYFRINGKIYYNFSVLAMMFGVHEKTIMNAWKDLPDEKKCAYEEQEAIMYVTYAGPQRQSRIFSRMPCTRVLHVIHEDYLPEIIAMRRVAGKHQRAELEKLLINNGDKNCAALNVAVEKYKASTGIEPEKIGSLMEDIEARRAAYKSVVNEFASHNLRLVVNMAISYQSQSSALFDLIQEGNVGLMRAVDKYDYKRGYTFSNYAVWWIRHMITHYLKEHSRTIRIPITAYLDNSRLTNAFKTFVHTVGREPTDEELAERVGLPVEKIWEIRNAFLPTVSLERKVGEDKDTELGDSISDDEDKSPEALNCSKNLSEVTEKILRCLTPKEKKVIRLRYGIGEKGGYTLDEIGQMFDLSRSRIGHIETKALEKLRKHRSAARLKDYLSS